jgi:ABC-2 type transport system ATP-binding protein
MTHALLDDAARAAPSSGDTSNVVHVEHVSHSYGRVHALRDVTFSVPRGALYALLGPNGSGKTTLLQILMGLRRAKSGSARVFGVDSAALSIGDRARIGYIAEGQPLPDWMRLDQLEAYLAPLYDSWDKDLARTLRERFMLDPSRKIKTLSRGEQMKAALLCALAPRPSLLVMDEPFTGMDALVKDELVNGLLETSSTEGWTVLLCSHDIGELDLLADWVGFLDRGHIAISEPMQTVRDRFRRVDVAWNDAMPARDTLRSKDWYSVEHGDRGLRFVAMIQSEAAARELAARFRGASRFEIREATLREIFVALARRSEGEINSVNAEGVA